MANTQSLVQYVVLRRDLYKELNWPLGSVVAQGCHASVAAIWESKESEQTQAYCGASNINHMHKVVLEIKGQEQLEKLTLQLQEAAIAHKLWHEQPENFPTCLATSPYPKEDVAQHFKHLKLCK